MPDGLPEVIGVCGAGTMGAGIAQVAAQAGARVLVHDPAPGAAQRALDGIRARLERAGATAALERLTLAPALDDLTDARLVIEAAPERLDLKRELVAALERVIGADAVVATNTSSLSVTEIAAGAARPERVVGMHFFNPAPVMRL